MRENLKKKMKVVNSGTCKTIQITSSIFNFVLNVLMNIGWTHNGMNTTVLDMKLVHIIVLMENGRCLTVSVNLIVVILD